MDDATKAKNDYWNKRLKRPAVTTAPTVDAFVAELSRRLQDDPAHRPDVRFVVLRSVRAVDTITWEGPAEARQLVSRILHAASQDFEMPAPFQMEPGVPASPLGHDGEGVDPII